MALLGTAQDASQQGGRGVPLPTGGVALYRPEHTQGGRAAVHGCRRAALPKNNRWAAGVVPRPAWRAIQTHEISIEPAEVDTAKRQEDGILSYIVLELASRGTHLQYGKQVTSRRRVDGQCTVPNQVGQSEEN